MEYTSENHNRQILKIGRKNRSMHPMMMREQQWDRSNCRHFRIDVCLHQRIYMRAFVNARKKRTLATKLSKFQHFEEEYSIHESPLGPVATCVTCIYVCTSYLTTTPRRPSVHDETFHDSTGSKKSCILYFNFVSCILTLNLIVSSSPVGDETKSTYLSNMNGSYFGP